MEGDFYSQHQDCATTEIQQLFEEPRDEKNLDECLGEGPSNLSAYFCEMNLTVQSEFGIYSPERNDGWTTWSGRPRGSRKKSNSWRCHIDLNPGCSANTSASRSKKRGQRRNNERWSAEEVKILVEGISKHGVGPRTKLRKEFFSRTVRTAVHIKDKWRNLLEATKKGKAQKTKPRHLDRTLVKRIQELTEKYPYPKPKLTLDL